MYCDLTIAKLLDQFTPPIMSHPMSDVNAGDGGRVMLLPAR